MLGQQRNQRPDRYFHQLRPEKVGAWMWGALEIELRTDQISPDKSESHHPY